MEKETLEEAAKNYSNKRHANINSEIVLAFIKGAKWQQERMYSEEDLKLAFFNGGNMKSIEEFDYWFEQFKKK